MIVLAERQNHLCPRPRTKQCRLAESVRKAEHVTTVWPFWWRPEHSGASGRFMSFHWFRALVPFMWQNPKHLSMSSPRMTTWRSGIRSLHRHVKYAALRRPIQRARNQVRRPRGAYWACQAWYWLCVRLPFGFLRGCRQRPVPCAKAPGWKRGAFGERA